MLKAMQKCAGLNEINLSFINQQFRIFSQRFQGDTAKLEKCKTVLALARAIVSRLSATARVVFDSNFFVYVKF